MKTIIKLSFCLVCIGLTFVGRTASGVTYDLTMEGENAFIDGGYSTFLISGYWTTINSEIPDGASGSGVFDSIVRIQNTGTEQGYNTSASNVLDNNAGFHEDVLFRDIPVVSGGNVEFFLDVNQQSTIGNPNSLITLNDVQIFLTLDAGQSTTNFTSGGLLQLTNATLLYSLDTYDLAGNKLVDNQVDTYTRSGSGKPELGLSISEQDFLDRIATLGWQNLDVYLVLYMNAGDPTAVPGSPYRSNDGFEEWNVRAAIPEPTTLLPLAGVLFAAVQRRRYLRKQKA